MAIRKAYAATGPTKMTECSDVPMASRYVTAPPTPAARMALGFSLVKSFHAAHMATRYSVCWNV